MARGVHLIKAVGPRYARPLIEALDACEKFCIGFKGLGQNSNLLIWCKKMVQVKKSENVPKAMRKKYEAIVEITNTFSKKNLNEEYAQLIRHAVAALCRKRPSPLATGKVDSWACGITHAIGMVNFLFDKSQTPHIGASDLYKEFGVGQSTGQGKSKLVREILNMYQLDPNWSLSSRLNSNPLVWMLSVNGMIVDVRGIPREFQEIAFEKGLIPYIPDDGQSI